MWPSSSTSSLAAVLEFYDEPLISLQCGQKHGDGARKRPCVFDDVSTVLFAGFAKKPMRFAIHSCGNVNVMT